MKKVLIWSVCIVVVILGMAIFSSWFESTHPDYGKHKSSEAIYPGFYDSRDHIDSLKRVIKQEEEFEKMKERKRIKDSLDIIKAQRQAIRESLNDDYEDGYEEGYNRGYEEGYEEGQEENQN